MKSNTTEKGIDFCNCGNCGSTFIEDVAANKTEWIHLKTNAITAQRKISYTGMPYGAIGIITILKVEVINTFSTYICDKCLQDNKNEAEKLLLPKLIAFEKEVLKWKKFKRIYWIIALIIFLIGILSFLIDWKLDMKYDWLLAVGFPSIIISCLMTAFQPTNEFVRPDVSDKIKLFLYETHAKAVRNKCVKESINADIMFNDSSVPSKGSGKEYILNKSTYDSEEYDGSALFHLEKRQFDPGGYHIVPMSIYDVRQYWSNKQNLKLVKYVLDYNEKFKE